MSFFFLLSFSFVFQVSRQTRLRYQFPSIVRSTNEMRVRNNIKKAATQLRIDHGGASP